MANQKKESVHDQLLEQAFVSYYCLRISTEPIYS